MSFKVKNDAELASLNEKELAAYFNDYMGYKEKALKDAIQANMNDAIGKLKSEIMEISDKRTEAITKSLEAQGIALAKMAASDTRTNVDSNSDDVELASKMKNLQNTGQGKVKFKSMTLAANAPTYTQGLVEQGMSRIAQRNPFLQNILNSGSLPNAGNVIYFEQANRVGDAGLTAEGVLKNESSFDLVEVNIPARKVTQFIKVSKEMISDIPFMESEIRNELVSRIALAVDAQLMSGTGGAQLVGILQNAVAFAAGAQALSVIDANHWDVLALAVSQVMQNNFTPNYILLNPADIRSMDVAKGSDGHYVLPSFVSKDGKEVKSTPIIMNNGVPAGQFLVLDSTKATVFTNTALEITVGFENDDFTKNMVTVLGEWRGVNRIKSNDYGAFVKGTFSTAIAAILKP